MLQHYYINDLKLVGKIESHIPYLYDKEKGWNVDHQNILKDRLIGYDGESIGNSSMIFKVDEITQDEAEKMIKNLDK